MPHPSTRSPSTVAILVLLVTGLTPTCARLAGAEAALAACPTPPALVVVLQPTEVRPLLTLTEGGGRLVHALSTDRAAVDALRRQLQAEERYGLAAVAEVASLRRLPYADDLVNLVIADLERLGEGAPSREEVLRVVAPCGVAWLREQGAWRAVVKPRPTGIDEWFGIQRGPDGNAASMDERVEPSNAIRWIASAWSNRANLSDRSVHTPIFDGRLFYEASITFGERRGRRLVECRDAWNGLPRWSVPSGHLDSMFWGGDGLLLSQSGKQFCALDARTGAGVVTYAEGFAVDEVGAGMGRTDAPWRAHLVGLSGGLHFQAARGEVRVLDARTGRLAWKHAEAGAYITHVRAVDGRLFVLFTEDRPAENFAFYGYPALPLVALTAFDLKTGSVVWRSTKLAGRFVHHVVAGSGKLVVSHYAATPGRAPGVKQWGQRPPAWMAAVDAGTGAIDWIREDFAFIDARGVRNTNQQLAIIDDVVYVLGNSFWAGISLETGADAVKNPVLAGDGSFECLLYRASRKYIILNYGLFSDLAGTRIPNTSICRVNCWNQYTPANGLLYTTPGNLAGAQDTWVGGLKALAEAPATPVPEAERLEVLDAGIRPTPEVAWPAPGTWPIHLGNAARTRSTPVALPTGALQVRWATPIAHPRSLPGPIADDWRLNDKLVGPVTAPVSDGALVLVAASEAHRLDALRAADGTRAWSFTAGGRIEAPPTLAGGMVFLGCADGWVHALRASDGTPAWRYFAGVTRRAIVSMAQIEAASPALASPLVVGGRLLVGAGRQSNADGGIRHALLDMATGRPVWTTTISGATPQTRPTAADLLVSDGQVAYGTRFAIDLADGALSEPYLLSTYAKEDTFVTLKGPGRLAGRSARLLVPSPDDRGPHYGFLNNVPNDGVRYGKLMGRRVAVSDTWVVVAQPGKLHLAGFPAATAGAVKQAEPAWSLPRPRPGNPRCTSLVIGGDAFAVAWWEEKAKTTTIEIRAVADGGERSRVQLDGEIAEDALIACGERFFATLTDGRVVCIGK